MNTLCEFCIYRSFLFDNLDKKEFALLTLSRKEVDFKKGDIILDPFSGSGTTLVQANEQGMHAIGIDISAFNTLIANVKIGKVDFKDLNIPLIRNIDGKIISKNDIVKKSLFDQISSPIRWNSVLDGFVDCEMILIIGPNKALEYSIKKRFCDISVFSISSNEDIHIVKNFIDEKTDNAN